MLIKFRLVYVVLVLALVTFTGVEQAYTRSSGQTCVSIFSSKTNEVPKIDNLYTAFPLSDFIKLKPQLLRLAQRLIDENREITQHNNTRISEPLPVARIKKIEHWPNPYLEKYPTFEVMVRGETAGIFIQSNGYVAMLAMSYHYRSPNEAKDYKVAYINKEGEVDTINQTALLLSTLPETVTLSRNMSEAERRNWINGRFGKFGLKLHFAPNYFKFDGTEPYIVQISKKDLIDFYERNELEINTYDTSSPEGLGNRVLTDIGIPLEIVFIGKDVPKRLQLLIKDQLNRKTSRRLKSTLK